MSARPTHDLCVKQGEYTDRQSGQTKGRWLKIGTVFKSDEGGTSIKLECFPVGLPEWNGWVSVFPRQQTSGHQQGSAAQRQPAPPPPAPTGFDDDIPF